MRRLETALMGLFAVVAGALLGAGCAASPGAPAAPTQPALPTPVAQPTAVAVVPATALPAVSPSTPAPATPTAGQSSGTTHPPVSLTPVAAGTAPTLQVTGQVGEVAASARVISFVEPVHGLQDVALTDSTRIAGPDGSPRTIQDIRPGMVIQATGWANGSGGIIADSVKIVTGPTPLPQ